MCPWGLVLVLSFWSSLFHRCWRWGWTCSRPASIEVSRRAPDPFTDTSLCPPSTEVSSPASSVWSPTQVWSVQFIRWDGATPERSSTLSFEEILMCFLLQSIMNWAKSHPDYNSDSKLFFFSFVAFASGQMSSYPLAVIRTQQQAQGSNRQHSDTVSDTGRDPR